MGKIGCGLSLALSKSLKFASEFVSAYVLQERWIVQRLNTTGKLGLPREIPQYIP